MIDRREILAEAERLTLLPNVVEKDYVLGWMLAGIYAHPDIRGSWVFKGGTCLKKCWFETYRFSEDLDFTLTDAAHLDDTFLKRVFGEVGQWIYDRTGIEIPADKQDFDIYQNPRGTISCEGKISYLGPVSPRSGGWPRIKLDLTADERLDQEDEVEDVEPRAPRGGEQTLEHLRNVDGGEPLGARELGLGLGRQRVGEADPRRRYGARGPGCRVARPRLEAT